MGVIGDQPGEEEEEDDASEAMGVSETSKGEEQEEAGEAEVELLLVPVGTTTEDANRADDLSVDTAGLVSFLPSSSSPIVPSISLSDEESCFSKPLLAFLFLMFSLSARLEGSEEG